MAFDRDSIQNTLFVAVALCLVCSLIVSAAAVGLRDKQEANKANEFKKNVLIAAGFVAKDEKDEDANPGKLKNKSPAEKITTKFEETIEVRAVDLESDSPTELSESDLSELGIKDLAGYDQVAAARKIDKGLGKELDEDPAGIKYRERIGLVYLIKGSSTVIIPIRGYGLWSTMKGFIALDRNSDRQWVVQGITFYEHGETPGLGAEIENPTWQAKFEGLNVFEPAEADKLGKVVLEVTKNIEDRKSQVDSLSGATITSTGVTNALRFWLGPNGYGPYLETLK